MAIKPRFSEEQIAHMKALKEEGKTNQEVADMYQIDKPLLHYYLNREKLIADKKNKVNKHTQVESRRDTKQFSIKLSGVKCILNLPHHLSVEAEATNEALIFNII